MSTNGKLALRYCGEQVAALLSRNFKVGLGAVWNQGPNQTSVSWGSFLKKGRREVSRKGRGNNVQRHKGKGPWPTWETVDRKLF